MSKNRTIEVPVNKLVKKYMLHSTNLGKKPIIERRHWLGKSIYSIMGYLPLRGIDLPIIPLERDGDFEQLTLEVTFPIKLEYVMQHHLYAIGQCIEANFELAMINFCRGRFYFSPNYHSAIDDFFKRYELCDMDVDQDSYRRHINKKYGPTIKDELKHLEEIKLQEVEKTVKMF